MTRVGASASASCGSRPGAWRWGCSRRRWCGVLARVPKQLGLMDALPPSANWWQLTPIAGRRGLLRPVGLLRGDPGHLRADHPAGRRLLPPPHPPRRAVGLRLRASRRAHAGFRGRLRAADPPYLPAVLQHATRTAHAFRPRAALQGHDRRSHLERPVPCRSAGLVQRAAASVAWLQQGRIATYLLYGFVTLLALLAVVL